MASQGGGGDLGNRSDNGGVEDHSGDGVNGGDQHRGGSSDLGARRKTLNADRQRGFQPSARIVTTTLNDMRAKEGALVSRFMTFLNSQQEEYVCF